MRKFSKKQYLVAGAAAVIVAAGTGAAYAYWTTGGTGTGTASAGTSTAVTVAQVGTVTGLVPGGTAQAVDFKINNPVSTNQYITSVAVSISSVTGPNITAGTPCAAGDFTLVQPTAIGQDLPSGDTTFSPSGASIAMTDAATNQDGCKGATVNLLFTAS